MRTKTIFVFLCACFVMLSEADARGMFCSRHPNYPSCIASRIARQRFYESDQYQCQPENGRADEQRCIAYRAELESYYTSGRYRRDFDAGDFDASKWQREEEFRREVLIWVIALLFCGLGFLGGFGLGSSSEKRSN